MGFQWCTLWAVFILQWSCLSLFVIGDWHHNNNTWGGVWGDKDIRCLSGYLLTSIDCLYLHHNTPLTSPHHRYIEQIYLSISLYINNWSDIVTYIIDLSLIHWCDLAWNISQVSKPHLYDVHTMYTAYIVLATLIFCHSIHQRPLEYFLISLYSQSPTHSYIHHIHTPTHTHIYIHVHTRT